MPGSKSGSASSLEQSALSVPGISVSLLLNCGVSSASNEQNLSGIVLGSPPGRSGTPPVPDRSGSDINRRKNPDVRKRLSGPALKTFFNIADAWELTVSEQCGLLGWIAPSTCHKYKAGNIGTLTYDCLTRLSLIIGIYKALHILYPDDVLADRWVKMPNDNPLFAGKPALAAMIDAGIDGLYKVRRLLDSRRGGWN